MLAVDKIRRVSAALLRHSALRHQCGGDVTDTQGHRGGTRHRSAVIPINISHSASLLPVTSQTPYDHSFDDVITPTDERRVTSFGAPATERTNTSTPRNYFGAAEAYNGTVNVNGVCFSVYGTLPRNLVRRRVRQGQVQGHVEPEGQSSSDEVRTLRRHRAPSPPERTNSINADLQRSPENDRESTLTRRRCAATPSECQENETAAMSDAITSRSQKDGDSWYSVTGNERTVPFANDDTDTVKHRPATSVAEDADEQRPANGVPESSENVTVPAQEFDSGTVRHRLESMNSQLTRHVTQQDDQRVKVDAEDASSEDVAVDLDQEFDGGTVRRRQKPTANDSCQLTDTLTTDVRCWSVHVVICFRFSLLVCLSACLPGRPLCQKCAKYFYKVA